MFVFPKVFLFEFNNLKVESKTVFYYSQLKVSFTDHWTGNGLQTEVPYIHLTCTFQVFTCFKYFITGNKYVGKYLFVLVYM